MVGESNIPTQVDVEWGQASGENGKPSQDYERKKRAREGEERKKDRRERRENGNRAVLESFYSL